MTQTELLLKELLELFLWDEGELLGLTPKLHEPPETADGLRSWLDDIASTDIGYPIENELMRKIVTRNLEIRGPDYSDADLATLLDELFPIPSEYFCTQVKPSPEQTMLRELVEHITARDEDMFVFFDLLRNPPEDGTIPAWIKTAVSDGRKLGFSDGVLRELITVSGKRRVFGFPKDKLPELTEQELGSANPAAATNN